MDKIYKLFLMVLVTTVIGFAMVSCDTGGGTTENAPGGGGIGPGSGGAAEAALNGTWVHIFIDENEYYETVLILNNGNLEIRDNGFPFLIGTYNVAANVIVITPTHRLGSMLSYWGYLGNVSLGPQWYTRDELILAVTNAGLSEHFVNGAMWEIYYAFAPFTYTFVLGDNTLSIISDEGHTTVFTRRD